MAEPRRKTKGNTPSKLGFSLGVFLILLAFTLMGVRVFLTGQTENPIIADQPPATDAPQATETPAPGRVTQLGKLPEAAVDMPIREHNPRMGRVNAPTEIIVFGHLGCLSCRKALRVAFNHAQANPMTTRVVSKFAMPAKTSGGDEHGVEAGLFAAIAQDERLYWEAFAHLGKTNNSLQDRNQILDALNAVGVGLKEVRTALADKSALYMRQLEQDLADFNALHADEIPVVVLNGRLMAPQSGQQIFKQLSNRLEALN